MNINQIVLVKRRRRTNQRLLLIVSVLLAWVLWLLFHELQQSRQAINAVFSQNHVDIQRNMKNSNDHIVLDKRKNTWFISAPIEHKASNVVVETLLAKLTNDCETVDQRQLQTTLTWFATVTTNTETFRIGQRNMINNGVYVQRGVQQPSLWLCDSLVASIALAPAINFMDKSLYDGELKAIVGSFGRLEILDGLDLSVLEVAAANDQQAQSATIADLTFISNQGKKTYQVLPNQDHQHLLLYAPDDSLIYVIAAQPKLNAILGL